MRNPDAKHLDFTELVGIIPDNKLWLASNLDMVFERKGKFLVCEWKRENEKISGGQKLLLKQLTKKKDFTVLIVVGNTDNGMVVEKFYKIISDDKMREIGTSLDDFKKFIISWYNNA